MDKIMNSALGCNYTGILLSASDLLHFDQDISSQDISSSFTRFLNLPHKDQEGFLIISLQRILTIFIRTSSFLCNWSFSTHGSGSVKLHIFVDPETWSLLIQITGTLIRILNLIPTVQYCTQGRKISQSLIVIQDEIWNSNWQLYSTGQKTKRYCTRIIYRSFCTWS